MDRRPAKPEPAYNSWSEGTYGTIVSLVCAERGCGGSIQLLLYDPGTRKKIIPFSGELLRDEEASVILRTMSWKRELLARGEVAVDLEDSFGEPKPTVSRSQFMRSPS
jgi:hypothetical protein